MGEFRVLLRRITEHIKAQNWMAVGLDFIIVVVGVFIGIQVSNWNDVQHNHAGSTWIAHQACCWPKPPNSVRFDARVGHIIGAVGTVASIGHMAGIDPVGRNFVSIHIHKITEILVCGWAVVTFQKVVDDILPVGLDVVGQPMPKCQLINIGSPVTNLGSQIA